MIVVDASAVVAAIVGNPATAEAIAERIGSTAAVAPDIVDVEVLSALRRLWLGQKLTEAQFRFGAADLEQLALERHSSLGLAPAIIDHRHNLTAYDASYVALAEALGCALLTLDARLAHAPGLRCEVELFV